MAALAAFFAQVAPPRDLAPIRRIGRAILVECRLGDEFVGFPQVISGASQRHWIQFGTFERLTKSTNLSNRIARAQCEIPSIVASNSMMRGMPTFAAAYIKVCQIEQIGYSDDPSLCFFSLISFSR
ncbi:hypothetical protein AB3Y40_13695 [Yoonia sp. R2331]|uniref:hypothetical protein n=1 Tax=Yoonia sp. R2331 TaxID=3237238 RepID=UPI0034E3EB8E